MLTAPPRLAALDVGTRRVGVAVADAGGVAVSPVGTFSPDEAMRVLARMHADTPFAAVAIGWPFEAGGVEGAQVERVRPWLGRVRRALPGVAVVPVDERHPTREARAVLHEGGAGRRAARRPGMVDAAAACRILERYVEEQSEAGAGGG